MEPIQPSILFLCAIGFIFVVQPIALWVGYHFMHVLEDPHSEEEGHGH